MICVHVLIRLFDCLEGGNTSRFKAATDLVTCLAYFFVCVTAVSFLSNPQSFRSQRHFVHSKTLYIHALTNIVSLPDAHAFRSQREIIAFRFPQNLVISNACRHHRLVNRAFRNAHSCNSWWGLQAFLYVFYTFHVLILSNIMLKALFARGDLSVTEVLTLLRVREIIAEYFDA